MRQFLRLEILAVAVVSCILSATAQVESVEKRVVVAGLPVNRIRCAVYESSPATMLYRDTLSLSSFNVVGDYCGSDEAYMEQLGKGHRLFSVGAESYMRLSKNSSVWGDASFSTGSYRDIRWTDCVDYLRLAPYVLGDSVGGDLSTRVYKFGGGWAGRFDRWVIGIGGSYRASVNYRGRDPRIKTIVSDFDVKLGAACRIVEGYMLGVGIVVNLYNQNCDLDFYNPMNGIDTYTLTGLGTYYKRFMGNMNKNSGYSSTGYSAGLQWVSEDRKGLCAAVDVSHYRLKQLLRDYNNLTLGYIDDVKAEAAINYRIGFGTNLTALPGVKFMYQDRKGTENLFGSVIGGSYPMIGSRSLYGHKLLSVSVSLPVQIKLSGADSYVTVTPKAVCENDRETYGLPKRKVEVAAITPGIDLDFVKTMGGWLWRAGMDMAHSFKDDRGAMFTDLDTASGVGRCVIHNYEMLKASASALNASLGLSRSVGGILWGLSLRYSTVAYASHGRSRRISITLNADF